jgi:hypothetical protein
MTEVRVFDVALDSYTLAGTVDLFALGIDVYSPNSSTVRVQSVSLDVYSPNASTVEMYAGIVDVFRTIDDGFRPGLADDDDPDFSPVLITDVIVPDFVPGSPALPVERLESAASTPRTPIEFNPYRPDLPDDSVEPKLYDYLRHQSETIREQHNKIQAGDTTFPFEMAYLLSDEPQFTLGSLTRFYHSRYGVLEGRYVRFAEPSLAGKFALEVEGPAWSVSTEGAQGKRNPVGLLLVDVPEANTYGWVQVSGIALQDLILEVPALDSERPLAWDAANEVLTYKAGIGVGSYVTGFPAIEIPASDPQRWRVQAGGVKLTNTGATPELTAQLISPELALIETRLIEIDARLDEEVVDYTPQLGALDASVARVTDRLGRETNARSRTDTQLLRRIRAVESRLDEQNAPTQGDLVSLSDRVTAIEEIAVPTVNRLAADYGVLLGITDNLTTRSNDLQADVDSLGAAVSAIQDRQIIPGTGLTGGGTLAQDRTLALSDTGVTPGTYTNANVEVDAQGRIVDVSSGSGGGGSVAVDDEGAEIVATASRLNFTGAGVTVTDGGSGEAIVDIPGGGGGGGGGLTLIDEIEVTSPLTTITFSGIPATYKDLRVTGQVRTTASGAQNVLVRFNNDSGGSSYSHSRSNRFGNEFWDSRSFMEAGSALGTATAADNFGMFSTDIIGYSSSSRHKGLIGQDFASADFGPYTNIYGGMWRGTAAIDRLDFTLSGGDFAVGTIIRLWGL